MLVWYCALIILRLAILREYAIMHPQKTGLKQPCAQTAGSAQTCTRASESQPIAQRAGKKCSRAQTNLGRQHSGSTHKIAAVHRGRQHSGSIHTVAQAYCQASGSTRCCNTQSWPCTEGADSSQCYSQFACSAVLISAQQSLPELGSSRHGTPALSRRHPACP